MDYNPPGLGTLIPGIMLWVVGGAVLILLIVSIFLVLRGVTLWYFRINEIVDTLKEINETLKKLGVEIVKDIDARNPPPMR